jgi:hypothetical protein
LTLIWVFHKVSFLSMATNIRLGWINMRRKNSLAHSDTNYIHIIKSFILSAPVGPNMGIPQG